MAAPDKADLVATDRSLLIHPQHHAASHEDPHVWISGKGSVLVDFEGRAFLDGLSGMWNVAVGHGREELARAASEQMRTLAFATSYAGSSTLPAIRLAEKLRERVYPGIEAFHFTLGGSDATDTSIRLARFYWNALGKPGKTKIVTRELSYHGSTVAGAAATGVEEFSRGFGERIPGFLRIPSPYPYRFQEHRHGVSDGIAAADLLETTILREGPETVAAFLAEPVQGGGGGVIVPPSDYFPRIREICDRHGILLISDDVITGFGRTGRWFGLEHWNVEPDIVQFAKGITSGYAPLGGVGVSSRIKAVLDDRGPDDRFWHGFTASGHPASCAVALANLDIVEREGLVERSAILGRRLLERLREGYSHPNVGDVRGLGLMAAVELIADPHTRARFPTTANVGARLGASLHGRGLVTRILGETICLAPPLSSSEAEVDRIADIVLETIHQELAP